MWSLSHSRTFDKSNINTRLETHSTELQTCVLVLKCIEGRIQGHIIPLTACYVIGKVYNGKCIDQMSTQVRVHILGKVSSSSCSVLRPVCEVTHQSWTGYWEKKYKDTNICQQQFFGDVIWMNNLSCSGLKITLPNWKSKFRPNKNGIRSLVDAFTWD